jgi:hypothetical protein
MTNSYPVLTEKELAELRTEIAQLRAEVTKLRVKVTDIDCLYDYIAEIHVHLRPVLSTVFPRYEETQRQIETFIESHGFYKPSSTPEK